MFYRKSIMLNFFLQDSRQVVFRRHRTMLLLGLVRKYNEEKPRNGQKLDNSSFYEYCYLHAVILDSSFGRIGS